MNGEKLTRRQTVPAELKYDWESFCIDFCINIIYILYHYFCLELVELHLPNRSSPDLSLCIHKIKTDEMLREDANVPRFLPQQSRLSGKP